MLNTQKILNDFPILTRPGANGLPLCYLDSGATSQRPNQVIDAAARFYTEINANVHRGVYRISEEATEAYESAREKIRAFLNAGSTREIIFTSGTTEAINLVARSWGAKNLNSGDRVVVTEFEHHSNLVPWQMLAAEKEIVLDVIPVLDDGTLDLDVYNELLKLGPKLIAVSGMSNVLGTIPPLEFMIPAAHEAGALVLVDGAQLVPHLKTDVRALDADFLVFSGHKMLAPTGIGVLYGKEALLKEMPPFFGGGDMIRKVFLRSFTVADLPYKFEAGTKPIAQAVGLGAAIDYLNLLRMDQIAAHEHELTLRAIKSLQAVPGLAIYGPLGGNRGSAISFTIEGIHPHDIASLLDREGICVRAGHHCAMPIHDRFRIPATTRASFYLYNTEADIERLCAGLKKVVSIFA